jgi:hypothetical protein
MDFYSHEPLVDRGRGYQPNGAGRQGDLRRRRRRDAQCDMASRVTCIMHPRL